MMVLNIGCGPWNPPGLVGRGTGWPQATEIGLDSDPRVKPDVVADMRALPFRDECFYGIIASHVLEHVPTGDVKLSLREMHRVLRSQGTLQVHVPDMEWVAKRIVEDGLRYNLLPVIYGCPGNTGGLGTHRMGFDTLSLIAYVRSEGFMETSMGTEMRRMAWWQVGEDMGKVEPKTFSELREIKLRARKR